MHLPPNFYARNSTFHRQTAWTPDPSSNYDAISDRHRMILTEIGLVVKLLALVFKVLQWQTSRAVRRRESTSHCHDHDLVLSAMAPATSGAGQPSNVSNTGPSNDAVSLDNVQNRKISSRRIEDGGIQVDPASNDPGLDVAVNVEGGKDGSSQG